MDAWATVFRFLGAKLNGATGDDDVHVEPDLRVRTLRSGVSAPVSIVDSADP